MTVGQWLKNAERQLKAAGIESALLDAKILAESLLKKNRAWLAAHTDFRLESKHTESLNRSLNRRISRQPLAYITGQREFYGFQFRVGPDVLIPRPETEYMVEEAIKSTPKNVSVLEIGTGSGCVAVALKLNRPDLRVTASDISSKALKIAGQNARIHQADITFVLSDLLKDVQGRFDLVLANLPYVPEDTRRMAELDFEPQLALYGGVDGLDYYRQLIPSLKSHLTEAGTAIVEAGPTQRRKLKLLAKSAGFSLHSVTVYVSVLSLSSRP